MGWGDTTTFGHKLIQAPTLDKVAALKSNPADDASPTFGELISQGKLPFVDDAQAAK